MAKMIKVKALRVVTTSPKGHFRRAGREFTSQPTDVRLDQLNRKQLEAIKNDPLLVAVDVESEVPESEG